MKYSIYNWKIKETQSTTLEWGPKALTTRNTRETWYANLIQTKEGKIMSILEK